MSDGAGSFMEELVSGHSLLVFAGEVGPFVGILCVIVEFLRSISISDIAPLRGA